MPQNRDPAMPTELAVPVVANAPRRVMLLGVAAVVVFFVASWLTVPTRPQDTVGFPAQILTGGLFRTAGGDEIMREVAADHPACRRDGAYQPPRLTTNCYIPTGERAPTYRVVNLGALRERIKIVSGGAAIVVVLVGVAFGGARRAPPHTASSSTQPPVRREDRLE